MCHRERDMKVYNVIIALASIFVLSSCEGNGKNIEFFAPKDDASKNTTDINTVNGSIMVLQRIALPKNAIITVTLSDASLFGVPSVILSQKSYNTKGHQSPFPFEINYKKSEVRPDAKVIVSATISVEGKLWYVTESLYEVVNNGVDNNVDMVLTAVDSDG